jgi:DNA invertase Pin-like site-specific DNA recombinase
MTTRFVSYLRVSTARQGASGLGLEAQRAAVLQHVNGHGELIAEFVEVESGKRNDRPQLAAAIARARATGGTLVIAKLDRLSRNVAFIAALMDSGVDFVAADMPLANRLTVHVLAAVAEHEREAISARTKAALAAARARGVRLGNAPGYCPCAGRGNTEAVAAIERRADDRASRLAPMVADIRANGITSLRGIARELTLRGALTARGGQWNASRVKLLLQRI